MINQASLSSKDIFVRRPSISITLKDPGSAITHFIGAAMALIATPALLVRTIENHGSPVHIISMLIFMLSMIMLYSASTIYHSVDSSDIINRRLRKLDHIMIFFLIAGSYTPVCLIVLNASRGWFIFSIVWGIAIAGTIIKALWITCPKWFSSVLYIGMGWVCLLAIKDIVVALSADALFWLVAGGVIYTLGGILYALKLKRFNILHPNFGSHEIFHLFVMAGSTCHFIMMYSYVAVMPI